MVSNRTLIFSEGGFCSRHAFGKVAGWTAGAACPGEEFCAAAESAPASVIRTLSFKSKHLPGRACSVLAANISSGLQATVTLIPRQRLVTQAQFAAAARCPGNLLQSVAPIRAVLPAKVKKVARAIGLRKVGRA